jgi:hypothetical protein
MLGPENFNRLGFYDNLTYYLYPREVAISLGQPPTFKMDGVTGHEPASLEELKQAGYDFAAQVLSDGRMPSDGTMQVLPLGSLPWQPPETRLRPIPESDGLVALLLPLAAAITGRRVVRWLFKDLDGILSTGERLASGLAVGAFFLTQLTLGLRLAGVRWERALTLVLMIWAVGEGLLLIRRGRFQRPQFKTRYLWWLLVIPAGVILWCQFRLAGLLGLQDGDAVTDWAFKPKILYSCAGKEIWMWFHNPALACAHLDYPLLVPLLHALTYGALGHVNEFVTKFWNQWMLLMLAWAVLGAGRFPERRPWLGAAMALAIVLLPMTRDFALKEGATIPMVFYTVLSSVQLGIGMVEKQAGRLRLGLLLLLATMMVKFEGVILLGLWGVLLLLDRESCPVLWPPRRVGLAGCLGLAAWLPYVVFRLHGPVPSVESGWVRQLLTHTSTVLGILPMTWVAMLSGRFVYFDFAVWSSPDNQHAVWQGHWAGWPSLVDAATQGLGWVCVLLLMVAWYLGGRLRWTVFRLFLVFLVYATMISLVFSAVHSSPMNYTMALSGSGVFRGGRYLYPVLMAWFVAGVILLLRTFTDQPANAASSLTVQGQSPRSSGAQAYVP